jgi:hypothetical protein
MNITGKITGIKYKILLAEELKEVGINDFDINTAPSSFLLRNNKFSFAISKWVSPKRTRSYPFERVYNTLNISKKITVIPIVKDEGQKGDRDYLQWDTVSLMSLLDVFVIFSYYTDAEKEGLKITNQQFDNQYVLSKIKEIEAYHSSALHWNLNELNINLHDVIDKVKLSYAKIEIKTGVKLHNERGLDNFKRKIGKDVSLFMEFSRDKAEKAQAREFVTLQPKESLSSLSKAKVTITNYLGGKYFLTVDEILLTNDTVSLIEGKHSKDAILPAKSDIKDGLLKMILYSNLLNVTLNGNSVKSEAILCLTAAKLQGAISSNDTKAEHTSFFTINKFSKKQITLIETVIAEAQENGFILKIQHAPNK